MINKVKNIVTVAAVSLFMLVMSVWCWFRFPDKYSYTERRPLKLHPEISVEALSDGSFMDNFEAGSMDQFPMRSSFRAVKAFSELGIFVKSDVNGLFVKDEHIFKNEYPINYKMLDHASDKFDFIYQKFLSEKKTSIYFSIIPDKSYFLPNTPDYLKMDYSEFIRYMRNKTPNMTYIDITGLLELNDYYRTDSHWRQEKITDIAGKLTLEMGVNFNNDFSVTHLDNEFYGVYSGQLGLPLKPEYAMIIPDHITYLSNKAIEGCTVTNLADDKVISAGVYNMGKIRGKDPYEMFLSGAEPLLKIENPDCSSGRRLIMFRDSFGSSLAPLLIGSYSEIILVDIRYIQSAALDSFINFDNQDILFIYSTLLLNNSTALK